MKYCSNCGKPIQDDMFFCSNCGTKVKIDESIKSDDSNNNRTDASIEYDHPNGSEIPVSTQSTPQKKQIGLRKGMKAGMIVFLVFTFLNLIMAFTPGDKIVWLGMTGFSLILALMFLLLAKSPKESPYILKNTKGLKKSVFAILCVILSLVSIIISTSLQAEQGKASVPSNAKSDVTTENESASTQKPEKTTTLSDVQDWYEKQLPSVGQSLSEYAQTVNGLSDLNVDSSRFLFGGDFNNCYYKFTFHCKIDGVNHSGEARAFLKYQDNSIKWFSFEVFGNDSIQSVVELYDDSYDQIIENYYKELVSNYS